MVIWRKQENCCMVSYCRRVWNEWVVLATVIPAVVLVWWSEKMLVFLQLYVWQGCNYTYQCVGTEVGPVGKFSDGALVVCVLQWWRHSLSLGWDDWSSSNITYSCDIVQRLSRSVVLMICMLLHCMYHYATWTYIGTVSGYHPQMFWLMTLVAPSGECLRGKAQLIGLLAALGAIVSGSLPSLAKPGCCRCPAWQRVCVIAALRSRLLCVMLSVRLSGLS